MSGFSEFIGFVDESGDHGLQSIDRDYPMFVLAFCVFEKETYASVVCPAVARLKFKYFGHDTAVLHEHAIRKTKAPYQFLGDPQLRAEFMADLSELIAGAPFTLIGSAIRKLDLAARYALPSNPYHLAMSFGLERLALHLGHQGVRRTHVIFERHGEREDSELELEFHRVCRGGNMLNRPLPLLPVMVDKKANSCGLQVADLVARPIGRHLLAPGQPNRAWDILESKFRRSPGGAVAGWGLKVFP